MRIDINNFKRLDVNCRYAFFFFFVENIIGNGGMGWCCMVGIRYRELEETEFVMYIIVHIPGDIRLPPRIR